LENTTKRITKVSNTRVDICGGTLDLWPLSVLIKDSKTINSSINCLTEASFTPKKSGYRIKVESPDFKEEFSFKSFESFYNSTDSKLSLIKEALNAFKDNKKFDDCNCGEFSETSSPLCGEWNLKSESPAGSGLGGSSSLLISIVKVFNECANLNLDESSLVLWAKNIETRVLKKPAGVQDYYPAVKPGLSVISFKSNGVKREFLEKDSLDFLNDHLILIDSQIKHHSGMNNWDIFKKTIDEDKKVTEALNELSLIANAFESALKEKSLSDVMSLFKRELKARKAVSDSYFNRDLEEYCKTLEDLKSVLAYKVCGAGGGGCLLLLCKKESKEELNLELDHLGLKVLPFGLTV